MSIKNIGFHLVGILTNGRACLGMLAISIALLNACLCEGEILTYLKLACIFVIAVQNSLKPSSTVCKTLGMKKFSVQFRWALALINEN